MNHKRLIPILAAALTVILLAGCGVGGESVQDNSNQDGLQTFGFAVNPPAQPSKAQEVSPDVTTNGNTGGEPEQNDQGESVSPSPSSSQNSTSGGDTTTTKPTSTATPTKAPTPTTQPSSEPTTSPTTSPVVSPPKPATSATYDEVMQYVGKQLSELIDELGYPVRSDYDYVDEEDPTQGENGTLYFSGGFTVTTLRNSDGEVITGINQE